mgnify:CR=1 FL=1
MYCGSYRCVTACKGAAGTQGGRRALRCCLRRGRAPARPTQLPNVRKPHPCLLPQPAHAYPRPATLPTRPTWCVRAGATGGTSQPPSHVACAPLMPFYVHSLFFWRASPLPTVHSFFDTRAFSNPSSCHPFLPGPILHRPYRRRPTSVAARHPILALQPCIPCTLYAFSCVGLTRRKVSVLVGSPA